MIPNDSGFKCDFDLPAAEGWGKKCLIGNSVMFMYSETSVGGP